MNSQVASLGGLLFMLAFLHFVVDWGFQTHLEAMTKAINWKVRARHCTVYTVGLVAFLLLALDIPWVDLGKSALILWVSHFLIDTYLPVYLWAKYIRKPPEMVEDQKAVVPNQYTGNLRLAENELERFKGFARTPLGLFLVISMDQAWHLLFLIPVAGLALFPAYSQTIFMVTAGALVALLGLVVIGAKKIKRRRM